MSVNSLPKLRGLLIASVDICITTDWKAMEGVCMIAELLAKSKYLRTSIPNISTENSINGIANLSLRWDAKGNMCIDCKGANCQDLRPRSQVVLRHERQQYSCTREYSNDKDIY